MSWLFRSSVVLTAPAYARPTPGVAETRPERFIRVGFRPRVIYISDRVRRFVPWNGYRTESATSQRAIDRAGAQAAFPAAATAGAVNTTELRDSGETDVGTG
jgi:hypothetical protein